MASFREQVATNVLTATRFRELAEDCPRQSSQRRSRIVRRAYELSLEHHSGQTARIRRALSCASPRSRDSAGGDEAGHHGHRRRTAARFRRRHHGHHRGDSGTVWRAGRSHRRGRNQDQQNRLRLPRGGAGGKRAQDDAGHGGRHPRGAHQIGRSPAQHAHPATPLARAPVENCQGDAGNLCSAGAPPRHGQGSRRA